MKLNKWTNKWQVKNKCYSLEVPAIAGNDPVFITHLNSRSLPFHKASGRKTINKRMRKLTEKIVL